MKILIDGIYKSTCYNGFLIWHFEAFHTDLSVFGLATDVKKIKQTHISYWRGNWCRVRVQFLFVWCGSFGKEGIVRPSIVLKHTLTGINSLFLWSLYDGRTILGSIQCSSSLLILLLFLMLDCKSVMCTTGVPFQLFQ